MRQSILTEEIIKFRVEQLGRLITLDHSGDSLTVLCVLKGGMVFCADLIRSINRPVRLEVVSASSYGDSTHSSASVKLQLWPDAEHIKGRTVLVVDDIVDSGRTLQEIVSRLKSQNPKEVKTAVLLDKIAGREVPFVPDYVGFPINDIFVYGYGMDSHGESRHLTSIWANDSRRCPDTQHPAAFTNVILQYVYHQLPSWQTWIAIRLVGLTVYLLDHRAARRHKQNAPGYNEAIHGDACGSCGHIGCKGTCGR